MIWKDISFLKRSETTADELGNPIYDWIVVGTGQARETPWTDEQIAILGREVTRDEQRLAIPYEAPDCERVIVDNVTYDVTEIVQHGPRYTVLQVKVTKQ